mmetsp:Transcript_5241/g.14869  ORF Transcript_5241/g.14869 Transcript_5241/m.14869 type:complete len:350 (+) Transcript_5241:632-1681(+)
MDGQVGGIAVVGIGGRLEHGGCLGEACSGLKHACVFFDVATQLGGRQLPPPDGLGDQVGTPIEHALTVPIEETEEQGIDGRHVAGVGLLGHLHSRMREHETRHLLKAAGDLIARFLEVESIALGNDSLEILVHLGLHHIQILLFVEVLPIADQEFDPLEGLHLGLGIILALRLFITLQGHPTIFAKQGQLLQIVLLDALVDVVDLVAAQQRTETENAGRQSHRRLVVEHALRVDQNDGHVLLLPRLGVGPTEIMRLVPDPDSRRIALGASAPIEAIVLSERIELGVPRLLFGRVHDAIAVGIAAGLGTGRRRPVQLEVAQEPAEEEGLARPEGPYDGNYRHLPARGYLG